MDERLPIHVIWGTAPDTDFADDGSDEPKLGKPVTKALDVEIEQEHADGYVLRHILGVFTAFIGQVQPGGTISVMITRGRLPTIDEPRPHTTTASFVINNPDSRKVWEYSVERRRATRG